MNKLTLKRIWLPVLLALAVLAGSLYAVLGRRLPAEVKANVIALPLDNTGFERADAPREFNFPADHGPHPGFHTEWWYFTGNLDTPDGRHFGYQFTIFRRAILSPGERQPRASDWAADQFYLAHFTLTDVSAGRFTARERFERGAAGLAGAEANPFLHTWVDGWQVQQTGENDFHIQASQDDIALDLSLTGVKGPVLQGDRGYSRKGPEPGNASYYISFTRLVTQGQVTSGGETLAVQGSSWMDHEYSTSALSGSQVGWDWFSFQLDDGSELMLYQLRNQDGSVDPYSSGTIIAPDGTSRTLTPQDFSIQVNQTWKSPHSGGVYPSSWTISVPAAGIRLDVEPLLADQELNLSFTYWEGAVRLRGEAGGRQVSGVGYIELTGYSGSLGGRL